MISEKLKRAASNAVTLRLNSWTGKDFKMNTYSCSNHACIATGLREPERKSIQSSMDRFESNNDIKPPTET